MLSLLAILFSGLAFASDDVISLDEWRKKASSPVKGPPDRSGGPALTFACLVDALVDKMSDMKFKESYIAEVKKVFSRDLEDDTAYLVYYWTSVDDRSLDVRQQYQAQKKYDVLLKLLKSISFTETAADVVASNLAEGLIFNDDVPRYLTDSQLSRDACELTEYLGTIGWSGDFVKAVAWRKAFTSPNWRNQKVLFYEWDRVRMIIDIVRKHLLKLGWDPSVVRLIALEHSCMLGVMETSPFIGADLLLDAQERMPELVEEYDRHLLDFYTDLENVGVKHHRATTFAAMFMTRWLWAKANGEVFPLAK